MLAAVLVLSCRKPSAEPEKTDAPPAQAPEGALVKGDRRHCSVVPCASGTCDVVCPPPEQMLTVDVQEPLRTLFYE